MAAVRRREQERETKLALEEFWKEMERARGTERDVSLRQLRVVVHENPYARIPLPSELFRGPYDERYGSDEGAIQRLYEGVEIAKIQDRDD